MADTIPGNQSSTQNLTIGASATSAIDSFGDVDWWRVSLQGGFSYQVWVEGASSTNGTLVDPYLAVYNSNGVFQFGNDDYSFSTRDSYTNITPTSTGTFFISAEEFGNNGTGSYTITIWEDQLASTASGATMAVNSRSGVGRLGYQNDNSDWYAVTLTAGIQYQFDMIGIAGDGAVAGLTLADPALFLRNSQGTQVAFDDDSGVGRNARIVFTPNTTGTYFLDAQTYAPNDFGSYRLIVNSSPSTGTIVLGTPTTGTIGFTGDIDVYSVTLTAGKTYSFTLDGVGLSDPFLEVLSSNGDVFSTDDNSGVGLNSSIQFTPTSSGKYFLAARSSGNSTTGGYVLTATALPSVSIAEGFAVLEGDSGTSNLVFEVKLSAPSTVPVSVDIFTSGSSTATVNVDYLARSSTLTFAPGQTSLSFTVQVLGDSIFEPTEVMRVILENPIGAGLGNTSADGLIFDNDAPYLLPSDAYITLQWYLYPTSGVNVFPLWPEYTGRGVKVAVFDQGIDSKHPDLDGNLLVSLGRNASSLSLGGNPILSNDNHGTAVAGTIAAERNGDGIVGVAYGASLVSIYSPLTFNAMAAAIPNAYSYALAFDVLNDSWGFANGFSSGTTWAFYDNFNTPQFAAAGLALAKLAATGRNGLGTVVVQSAGNSFSLGDDTNLHNFQNSQYIITVAATDYFGRSTAYSSPGASVLVSAPGGGGSNFASQILTTDRMAGAGDDDSDYQTTTGTSFSAPIVSGVVALMLEANPRLGYRDVQEILASTARITAVADNTWRYNGASQWNGGGMHYDALSHDLGFGLVDARAAVRLAETWQGVHTAANREQVSVTRTPSKLIPDNSNSGASDAATITSNVEVERVEVTLKVTHSFVGDLSVLLTSPSGTTSFLLWRPQQTALNSFGTSQDNINFTFTTVLSMGESAAGTWSLSVFDNAALSVGIFDSWTLNIIGKPASADDTFVFTDEYAESLSALSARGTLTDTAGVDTLNASAVSTSSVLNLNAGATNTIDGAALRMAAGTVLENAIGGDGNDTITGNASVNSLMGMRGNDTLQGGSGNDLLDGGQGGDLAVFSGKFADYLVTFDALSSTYSVKDSVSSRDDTDKLIAVEQLQFSDGTRQLATSDALLVGRFYQAIFGMAPGSTSFSDSLSKVGPTGSALDWVKTQAAAVSNLSDAAFTTLVLNNISVTNKSLIATPTFGSSQQAYDALHQAMTGYLGVVGSANRGIVAAQVATIIAGFEGETVYGVYGTAAAAFNKQVGSNLAHSINSSNTTDIIAVPVMASGSVTANNNNFSYMLAMGNYAYQIGGFGTGDKIIGPAGATSSFTNANASDGSATLQFTAGSQTVTVTLTGLTNAQDSALTGLSAFNSVFGLGTLA